MFKSNNGADNFGISKYKVNIKLRMKNHCIMGGNLFLGGGGGNPRAPTLLNGTLQIEEIYISFMYKTNCNGKALLTMVHEMPTCSCFCSFGSAPVDAISNLITFLHSTRFCQNSLITKWIPRHDYDDTIILCRIDDLIC